MSIWNHTTLKYKYYEHNTFLLIGYVADVYDFLLSTPRVELKAIEEEESARGSASATQHNAAEGT